MIKKVFRKLVFIETAAMFATMAALFVDTSVTGIFLDNDALSAAALCSPVLFFLVTIGGTLSVGAKVLYSKSIGENDTSQRNNVFSSITSAAFAVSIPFTIIIEIFTPQIAVILGAEAGTGQFIETCNYLRGYCIGTPFFTYFLCLSSFLIMSEKSTYSPISNVALFIADVIFDLLNVYVFNLGMLGMGLASSISHFVAMTVALIPFVSRKIRFSYHITATRLSIILESFKQGVNYAIRHVSKSAKFYIFNQLFIASGVPHVLAIYAVISSFSNVFSTIASAIGKTSLSLSKLYATSKDKIRLKTLFNRGILDSFLLNIPIIIVVILFPKLVLKISLNPGSEIFGVTAIALILFITSIIPNSINRCLINFYQGIGKLRLSSCFSIMHSFAGPIIALYLLVIMHTINIWWFFLIEELIVFCLIAVYIAITQRPFTRASNPFMMLNCVEDINSIAVPVSERSDIFDVCDRIVDFMKRNSASQRETEYGMGFINHYLNLFAEQAKKNSHTEVRVIKEVGSTIIVIENDDFKMPISSVEDSIPLFLSDYKEEISTDKALSVNRVSWEIKAGQI